MTVLDRRSGRPRVVPLSAPSEADAVRQAGLFGAVLEVRRSGASLEAGGAEFGVSVIDRETGVERRVMLSAASEEEAARLAGEIGVVGTVERQQAEARAPGVVALAEESWRRLERVLDGREVFGPGDWKMLQRTIAWGVVRGLFYWTLICAGIMLAGWMIVFLFLLLIAASAGGP